MDIQDGQPPIEKKNTAVGDMKVPSRGTDVVTYVVIILIVFVVVVAVLTIWGPSFGNVFSGNISI